MNSGVIDHRVSDVVADARRKAAGVTSPTRRETIVIQAMKALHKAEKELRHELDEADRGIGRQRAPVWVRSGPKNPRKLHERLAAAVLRATANIECLRSADGA